MFLLVPEETEITELVTVNVADLVVVAVKLVVTAKLIHQQKNLERTKKKRKFLPLAVGAVCVVVFVETDTAVLETVTIEVTVVDRVEIFIVVEVTVPGG